MEDFENIDGKTKCLCISLTSLVIVVVSFIAFSFGSVEPTEYGVMYNKISKRINEDPANVQEGGL